MQRCADVVCDLCESEEVRVAFEGPIRKGGVYSAHTNEYTVYSCDQCGVEFLDDTSGNQSEYEYNSRDYWENHKEGLDIGKLQRSHDEQQLRWLNLIGVGEFREAVVADFGCGAGQFLDLVGGVAARTIGVDPARHFHDHLRASGHEARSFPDEVENSIVSAAISFDTLEHIHDPREFLESVEESLQEGGKFFLGVPNQNDFLKDLVPDYRSFFYHTSHKWYFHEDSLGNLINATGFEIEEVVYTHKYNLTNAFVWAADQMPDGHTQPAMFDAETEDVFCRSVEREGRSSHLLMVLAK